MICLRRIAAFSMVFSLLLGSVGPAASGASAQAAQPAMPAADASSGGEVTLEQVLAHLPDLETGRQQALEKLEEARQASHEADAAYYTGILEQLDKVRRPTQVRLSLEDVIRRTLANNYTIQTLSYNPAVETTRIVEAEAAFDAVLFGTARRDRTDRPTANQLFATDSDSFTGTIGVRKLLPLGTTVSGTYNLSREKTSFQFQDPALNPSYMTTFVLDIRQPLLRGFGLDYNRSLILINKNNRRISDLAFRRQVRDTLRTVEELYWRLVEARRSVLITAWELSDFEKMYRLLEARKDFDVLPVSLFATEAGLERARADMVGQLARMFEAEDRLVATMNDPEIPLGGGVECVPTEFPRLDRIMVNRMAEVQTGLDHRLELKEQELAIATAKIGVGQAINAELPRFDFTFSTSIAGLGASSDRSFDKATAGNFISYTIGVELEVPIGNRSARAVRRRAELQHSQAVAELRRRLEDVILDVNLAVRRLDTAYDQILPGFASVEARLREVRSTIARAERKDYGALNAELGAWRSLASTRRAILNTLVEYNISIADLERAKGTLLPYNNVIIPTEED